MQLMHSIEFVHQVPLFKQYSRGNPHSGFAIAATEQTSNPALTKTNKKARTRRAEQYFAFGLHRPRIGSGATQR